MKIDKEIWKNYLRIEKVGVILYSFFLIGFAIFLIYLIYFSPEITKIKELIYVSTSPLFDALWFGFSILGLYLVCIFYAVLMEWLFYPESKCDLFIKNKRKEFRKKYPARLAHLKIKQLKTKKTLLDLGDQIKNWNKK